MPYAFAHPAAVVPLAKLLGPRAVPSALAIGSMVPDAWYIVPLVEREHSHAGPGAVAFCLVAGLIAYLAFHYVFKQPLLGLIPRGIASRVATWLTPGLPAVPWRWVVISLLAGIGTHLFWDAFTHRGHLEFVEAVLFPGVPLYRALQHASTLLGTALLGLWLWRKLRAAPARADVPQAPRALRLAALAAMVLLPLAALLGTVDALQGIHWRTGLRAGAVIALSTFGLVALSFCVAWRLSPRLRAQPRPPARACATAPPR
jgi:hypothetical protein